MDKNELDAWRLLLKSIEFFKTFDDKELVEILGIAEVRKYPPFSYIIQEKKLDYTFFIIVRGNADIIKMTEHKGKRKISSLAEGDCFGEMALVMNQPRSASVMARGEVVALVVDGKQIDKLNVEIREKLFRRFALSLAQRLMQSSQDKAVFS
jgi:CRP-like cAMP-binding protein